MVRAADGGRWPAAGPCAVLLLRHRPARTPRGGGGGQCAPPAALLVGALGFWWWTGLAATRVRYAEGIATIRPYDYFVLANLAAFAVALGPATVAGLASLHRRSRLRWPVGAALLAVAGADLSGLSKGEVERIWLPIGAACAYGDLEGHVWFELKFVRVDQSRPAAQVGATNPGQ